MDDLFGIGMQVRGLVTDNHSANVAAFNVLLSSMPGDKKNFFVHPKASTKTYVLFDSVHLLKNVRNNLLNSRKFVFPAMDFSVCGSSIVSEVGYITWGDLHKIHDHDQKNDAHLRKAPKLSYQALHPGNKKKCINFASAIFHETTIAAYQGLSPDRIDMTNFLKLINVWWTCTNSRSRYTSNFLANAMIPEDDKLDFFRKLADWLEAWAAECINFGLSKQTFNALILTLRSHSMLIQDLFADGYEYVQCSKLQSDPVERRFSQYRAMSGGRFLVSLREVESSEKILKCRSLLKLDHNYWLDSEEHGEEEILEENTNKLLAILEEKEEEILEATLSSESEQVAHYIAGNISKRIHQASNCKMCEAKLIDSDVKTVNMRSSYLLDLSRGGLTVPSKAVSDFVANGYALLDLFDQYISNKVRHLSLVALEKYSPRSALGCEAHMDRNRKFFFKVLVNTFYNNKQHRTTDIVRENTVKSFKKNQRNKE